MMPTRTPSHSAKPTLVCMVVCRSTATASISSAVLPASTLPSALIDFALNSTPSTRLVLPEWRWPKKPTTRTSEGLYVFMWTPTEGVKPSLAGDTGARGPGYTATDGLELRNPIPHHDLGRIARSGARRGGGGLSAAPAARGARRPAG